MLKGTPASDTASCDILLVARNVAFGQKHRIRGTPGLVFEDGRQQAARWKPSRSRSSLSRRVKKAPG